MRTSDQNPRLVSPGLKPRDVSSESRYATLSDLGQLLLRSLDPAVLYEAVIEVLERRIGARLVMVGEVDRASGWFRRIAPAHVPAGMEDIYPVQLPFAVATTSFWQGTPQLEADIAQMSGMESFRQAFKRHGVTSSIAVPVLTLGEVQAGLVIRSSDVDFFSPTMIELLQQAAASIGLGLEAYQQRMRLLQSVRDEARQRQALRLLSEMIKVVSRSREEPQLLADACHVAGHIGEYALAWIGFSRSTDESGIQWHSRHGFGHDGALDRGTVSCVESRASDIALMAMRAGELQVRYPSSSGLYQEQADDNARSLRALLALPLRVDDAVVGALVIGTTQADAFSAIEIQVFSEMGIELGLGIQFQRARAARLSAERELRFNLQHFRTILSHQHSGILVISEEGRVMFANEAFCALYGFEQTPAELENQTSSVIFERLTDAYRDPDTEFLRLGEILHRGVAIKDEEVHMRDGRILLRDFTPIYIDGVRHGRIWNQRDVTSQKTQQASVHRLAFYDVVTELPNRRLLFDLLEKARSTARQPSLLAIGVLDLDRFKSVNDTIGHDGGDQVLVEASARMRGLLRPVDVLARFGGDEFALMIPGLDSKEQLDAISRCILQALRLPFHCSGEQLHLSASIGWTLFPLDPADAEGLVRHADLAMYAAKQQGKDRGALYEPAMELEQLRLQAMRERVAQALVQAGLRLLFQPIVYVDGLAGLQGVAGM